MHVLPAELERGTEVLQFDVCCKAIDQNFDCGCDRCAILRLDSLMKVPPDHYKGLQVTSKGHAPLVDSGCRHGKFQSRYYGHPIINYS